MTGDSSSPTVRGNVWKPEQAGMPPRMLDKMQDDMEVDLRIELGRTSIAPDKLAELGEGCLVTLDNGEHDPVEIFVQGRLIARGEIVVLDDRFGVRITELVTPLSMVPCSKGPSSMGPLSMGQASRRA